MTLVNKKEFSRDRSEMHLKKKKRSIENNLNTQTRVNRSTYLKTELRNQLFSYNRGELLKDDG